ncbi:unnamed protein product [Owenia fusiformis]|uniref:Uncharacterized protein n=1 Tax=Owenia fusiformis TaxID=6347 RepID=A0A8J1THT3_OWEFU|nr:unnamed protein product [Owenia fusiformis]
MFSIVFILQILIIHVLVVGCARITESRVQVLPALITLLEPKGVRFLVEDPAPGTSLIEFHYSINTPLLDVDAGRWNYDVRAKTGDVWVHENRNVLLNPGDIVYYWLNALVDDLAYRLLEQRYIIPGDGRPVQQNQSPCDDNLRLMLDEKFSTFDLNTWQHEVTANGGGNREFQVYTPEQGNVYVRDKTLFIKPTLTSDRFDEDFVKYGTMDVASIWGRCTSNYSNGCLKQGDGRNIVSPIMSGKIRTKLSFRYGRIEVVSKMPRGDWIWPAIWMMPQKNEYGHWPRSGEIDICESRGNVDYGGIGVHTVGSTLHWGTDYHSDRMRMTHGHKKLQGLSFGEKFVKYTLDWDALGIRVYYDGELVLNASTPKNGYYRYGYLPFNPWENSANDAPFDKEFYLILNVAVGGNNYFPDGVPNSRKPWENKSRFAPGDFWKKKNDWYATWKGEDAAMQIKSVKIWKRVD